MLINFPTSGLVANVTTYTYSDRVWLWNGVAWQSVGTVQGLTGPQGLTGIQGTQGIQGTSIQGITGLQGTTGTQGTNGIQGNQGTIGNQGTTGIQGSVGTQGNQGITGNQGIQGIQGVQGVQGTTGIQGTIGRDGNFGGASFDYTYSTTITATDPGVGKVQFNSLTLSSATAVYLDSSNDASTDISSFLNTIGTSTSTIKGHFRMSKKFDSNSFVLFTITSVTNNTGWFTVNSSYVSGNGTFTNLDDIIITFARTGDKGDTGLQGLTGTQGANGVQGFTGSQGTQGLQGTTGTQGVQGTQGIQGLTGLQGVQGRYTLSATAPSSPVVGDAWVDTDDGRTYIYDATGWFEPYDNLIGLQGTQGVQGTFGPATVPLNAQTSSYTLAATDNGKLIAITTGGVTVPVNIFSTGNNIVIYNNSASSQTITQGTSTTLRLSGTASTGNRTLSQYGIATIICVDATAGAHVFTISGAGLS